MDTFGEPLLTGEEVAEYLKVDVATVRRLVSRGELAVYRVESEYRFTQQDVGDYLQRQYLPARPAAGAEQVVEPGPLEQLGRALQVGLAAGRDKLRQDERFSPGTAQALSDAAELARHARTAAVGSSRLLVGLLRAGGGVAGQALNYYAVVQRQARAAAPTPSAHKPAEGSQP